MIDIQIGLDGVPSQRNITLGNKYENKDEVVQFQLPSEFDSYNKYVIGVIKINKAPHTVVLPVTNNSFYVSSKLTYHPGKWDIYLMCREHELDLSNNPVDVAPKDNEHVFISDRIIGTIVDSSIEKDNVENEPLDENLQVVYDNLVALIAQVKGDLEDGAYDGFSPIASFEELANNWGYKLSITDKEGQKQIDILHGKDYVHSEEFEKLSNQVRQDAQTSTEAVQRVTSMKESVEQSQAEVLEVKSYVDEVNNESKQIETNIDAAQENVKELEQSAKASADASLQSRNAAKISETNAKTSETNAANSESSAKETLTQVQSIKSGIDATAQEVETNSSLADISAKSAQQAMTEANATAEKNVSDLNSVKQTALSEITTNKDTAVTSIQKASEDGVDSINTAEEESLETINTIVDSAVSTINSKLEEAESALEQANQTAQENLEAIGEASTQAQSDIISTKETALTEIQSAQSQATSTIQSNQAQAEWSVSAKTTESLSGLEQAKTQATSEIESSKTSALGEIETAKDEAIEEIENTGVPLEDIEKLAIKETAQGNPTIISDSADWRLQSLNVYGQNSQDGTPTPETPVEIISKEVSEIKVTNGDDLSQTITLEEPIALRGIPVASDGNVTIDGQQYISDVICEKDGVIGVERNIAEVKKPNGTNFVFSKVGQGSSGERFFAYYDLFEVGTFNTSVEVKNKNAQVFSNFAKALVWATTPQSGEWTFDLIGSGIRVNPPLEEFNDMTAEKMNTILSSIDTVFIGLIGTPTFEPLPEDIQSQIKALKTYYPNTVIDCGAYNKVEYVADTKMYIDKQVAALSEAMLER